MPLGGGRLMGGAWGVAPGRGPPLTPDDDLKDENDFTCKMSSIRVSSGLCTKQRVVSFSHAPLRT